MATKLVWKRILHLLYEVYVSRIYKWGAMMWVDIKGEAQHYEQENVTFALHTRGRCVEEVLECMSINSMQNGVVWETIGLITL